VWVKGVLRDRAQPGPLGAPGIPSEAGRGCEVLGVTKHKAQTLWTLLASTTRRRCVHLRFLTRVSEKCPVFSLRLLSPRCRPGPTRLSGSCSGEQAQAGLPRPELRSLPISLPQAGVIRGNCPSCYLPAACAVLPNTSNWIGVIFALPNAVGWRGGNDPGEAEEGGVGGSRLPPRPSRAVLLQPIKRGGTNGWESGWASRSAPAPRPCGERPPVGPPPPGPGTGEALRESGRRALPRRKVKVLPPPGGNRLPNR